jgi:hypothetical protein
MQRRRGVGETLGNEQWYVSCVTPIAFNQAEHVKKTATITSFFCGDIRYIFLKKLAWE